VPVHHVHVTDDRAWGARADALAARAMAGGAPTRWFDELWSEAESDRIDVPWDHDDPADVVADHVRAAGDGVGRRAVVVGAGLGADAEVLAENGWRTVAFDISPAAVRLATARRPGSEVDYRVADLLDLPAEMVGAFDLVVEVFTVQAMAPALRTRAQAGLRSLLAPGGTLLAVQFVRGDRPAEEGPPWLLDRTEMEAFAGDDVRLRSWTTVAHGERPDGPDRWVAVLERDA
jgi:SAM-dependent methyltransferase